MYLTFLNDSNLFFSFLEIHLKLLAPFRPVTGTSHKLGGKTFVLTEGHY